MLDGVGEEESLVATGGAADHLAVVYNTDDQVTFFSDPGPIIVYPCQHLTH